MTELRVLDCSLRDGGYYNQWDFGPELRDAYLRCMGAISIDAVEVGFRSAVSKGFAGAHYFTTDEYLSRIPLPANAEIAVMTNASDFLADQAGPAACVERLFNTRAQSPVGLVRVAAHYEQAAEVVPALRRLKDLGYQVALNLMQVSERSETDLATTARIAADAGVDILYIADSLGVLDGERVTQIIETLRQSWHGDLGIHTHDNMLRALDNSLAAVRAGAKWVDGTVLGMGRGPGNVRTEFLLLQFNQAFGTNYNALPIIDLIRDEFEPLQQRYGWGPNPYYFLSAVHSIHPTYIQEMMSDRRYSSEDIAHAIEFLKNSGSRSFRSDTLHKATSFYGKAATSSRDVSGWARGRPMLLVARGPGAERHRDGLLRFIERYQPIVLALNRFVAVPEEAIDAWAACHPMRLGAELGLYEGIRKPLVAPLSELPAHYRSRMPEIEVLDYGLGIEAGRFEFHAHGCAIPKPLVAAYACAFANSAGASRVFLAGFDGFPLGDPRQSEMAEVFDLYQNTPETAPLIAITPTTHAIETASVYDPWIEL